LEDLFQDRSSEALFFIENASPSLGKLGINMANKNLIVTMVLATLIAMLICNATDDSTGNLSDLWSWGDLPIGYTMNGNQIIQGSPLEPDNESVMETPSQLEPDNNLENTAGGMLVMPSTAGQNILSNINKSASNSTNFTAKSTNASTGKLSDLWSWGGLPAGYTMNGNQIIQGFPLEPDNESVMETPSQLEPDNNVGNTAEGMLVGPK
jgi:hypothetical protein